MHLQFLQGIIGFDDDDEEEEELGEDDEEEGEEEEEEVRRPRPPMPPAQRQPPFAPPPAHLSGRSKPLAPWPYPTISYPGGRRGGLVIVRKRIWRAPTTEECPADSELKSDAAAAGAL